MLTTNQIRSTDPRLRTISEEGLTRAVTELRTVAEIILGLYAEEAEEWGSTPINKGSLFE